MNLKNQKIKGLSSAIYRQQALVATKMILLYREAIFCGCGGKTEKYHLNAKASI